MNKIYNMNPTEIENFIKNKLLACANIDKENNLCEFYSEACQKFYTGMIQVDEKIELFAFDIDLSKYSIHNKNNCDYIVATVTHFIYNTVTEYLGTKTFRLTNDIQVHSSVAHCVCYGERLP
jgi:hypothetical protein